MTRTHRFPRISAASLLLGACLIQVGPGARAAAAAGSATDITAAVLANQNITLTGPSLVTVPAGAATTYSGVLSGQGTLTVAGRGTLIMTKDSDFTLPAADRHQKVTTSGGNWPYPIVTDPDQPAVIVEPGATLQYGDGGASGIIGDYPYTQVASPTLNQDNIEVDGTLTLDISDREYNLGTITGSGLIDQPRNTWGTLDLADDLPFTGTIGNGTGMNFGSAAFRLSLPRAKAVENDGSAILSARDYTMVLPQNFIEDAYGSDINFHTWQAGLIEMTGVDEYADPSLDTATVAHTANERGINIEGAHVQWGDGTTDRFFLPATPQNSYINIHKNGTLAFDYDGPVTLDTPISGGIYHNSLSTPADADVTISATPGNAVTFATPMNYHGVTTIGHGAQLLLGTGRKGGDSSLLHGGAADQIVDDGNLTVRNTSTATTLTRITGTGSVTQDATATTTLAGPNTYTGATTVESGRLMPSGPNSLATSSGVALTGPKATLDLTAGSQTLKQLTGVAGSVVEIGARTTLTVGSLYQAPGETLDLALPSSGPAIQANGPVELHGTLAVTAADASALPASITLIHDAEANAVKGAFAGLAQGAAVSVNGKTYRIDYAAGNGHDVVLTTASVGAAAAASPSSAKMVADTNTAAGSRTQGSVNALVAVVVAAFAVGAVILLLILKRRGIARPQGRRRAGTHAR